METFTSWVTTLNGIVWGPPMLVLILGTGFFLMVGLRLMWAGRHAQGKGNITPFNALMTALSATVGTGNIAGVATAIGIGGPGALFWMWCTALVGMATKYAEGVLAIKYREIDEKGNYVGGPMYYIKNGLGRRWIWLGTAFAIFGGFAGFGIGNMVQANSVAELLDKNLGIAREWSGLGMALLVGLVIIGGIRWIAQVSGKLVPFMAFFYVIGGLAVLALNLEKIPEALYQIVMHAFSPTAAVGGFAGATLMMGIQMGVARGIYRSGDHGDGRMDEWS